MKVSGTPRIVSRHDHRVSELVGEILVGPLRTQSRRYSAGLLSPTTSSRTPDRVDLERSGSMMRAATRPWLSNTHVVGMAVVGSDFLNDSSNAPPWSVKLGYVMPTAELKAFAAWGSDLLTMPTNCTFLEAYSSATTFSTGASARHGTHH